MSKQSSPDYELPPGHPSTRFSQLDIPLNHAVLRDIRTIVQILRYDGPLTDFLGGRGYIQGDPTSDSDETFSIPVPRDDIVHLFDAWRGIERVFGDLDDNRLHPNGWDKLRFVFSSKSERGDTDSLLEDNNEDTSRTQHGVVGRLEHTGYQPSCSLKRKMEEENNDGDDSDADSSRSVGSSTVPRKQLACFLRM